LFVVFSPQGQYSTWLVVVVISCSSHNFSLIVILLHGEVINLTSLGFSYQNQFILMCSPLDNLQKYLVWPIILFKDVSSFLRVEVPVGVNWKTIYQN